MARKWSCIKAPAELRERLKLLAGKESKAMWQVIAEALSFYESLKRHREHYTKSTDMDKLAYYIVKLVTSAAYLKMSPSKESLERFLATVDQLEKRLGIECQELRPAAERVARKRDGRSIHTLNMVMKACVIRLIGLMLGPGGR